MKKRLVFKFGLVLLLVGFFKVGHSTDGRREFTKVIKKEFPIDVNGTVKISNKYGKVDIKIWENPRVKLGVEIIVNASNEEKAQKVFDRIKIEFSESHAYLGAVTSIQNSKHNWWDTSINNSDYQINYLVYLPASINLELDNQYGNVFVGAMQGTSNISLKYCNFKLDGLNELARLGIDYSTGTIDRAKNVQLTSNHGTIRIFDVGDMNIESKYTNIQIEKAIDIICKTKYDNYSIGVIRDLRNEGAFDNIDVDFSESILINSRYSNCSIGKVKKSLDLALENSDVVVKEVSKNFSNINLIGEYSDFKIGLENGAVYQLDAEGDYAGIGYPKALMVTYEKEKASVHEVKGHVGKKNGSVIKAKIRFGALILKQ
ncbi:MAG: hypothetical protein DHS20C18_21460 [Saprospiraceae bacterium]|nr:MAG: hypothetical protein DHS20C18_21460 [Saprospiraceae bacterium]